MHLSWLLRLRCFEALQIELTLPSVGLGVSHEFLEVSLLCIVDNQLLSSDWISMNAGSANDGTTLGGCRRADLVLSTQEIYTHMA